MEQYGLIMNDEIGRRVDVMCNLSEVVMEKGTNICPMDFSSSQMAIRIVSLPQPKIFVVKYLKLGHKKTGH